MDRSDDLDPALLALAASRDIGALAALKRDGRPQLSMVNFALDRRRTRRRPTVRVSVVDGRAKVANLRRDPRASLLVTSPDGWSYAVLEGDVELSPVAGGHGRRRRWTSSSSVYRDHPRRGPPRLGRLPAGDGRRTAAWCCRLRVSPGLRAGPLTGPVARPSSPTGSRRCPAQPHGIPVAASSADDVLDALDPEQREVAAHPLGPMCVLAGAGTGKTRAITHRIAYGVHSGAYQPQRVLAVTFTARAAGEMRTRLRDARRSAGCRPAPSTPPRCGSCTTSGRRRSAGPPPR